MKDVFRRVARAAIIIVQWSVFALLAIVAVSLLNDALHKRALGLDTTTYLIACALMAFVTIMLSPPVFFRLPTKAKVGSYVAAPLAFVALAWAMVVVNQAYERTPEGAMKAKVAAAEAERESQQREVEENARQNEERQAEWAQTLKERDRNVAEAHRKVQRCINWQGQIPSLVRLTKENLHNPRSFEHVRTEMKTIGDTPAVVMFYRAENGFGATRIEAVSAFISTDDCSVVAAKEYEPGDM